MRIADFDQAEGQWVALEKGGTQKRYVKAGEVASDFRDVHLQSPGVLALNPSGPNVKTGELPDKILVDVSTGGHVGHGTVSEWIAVYEFRAEGSQSEDYRPRRAPESEDYRPQRG